ncbi:bifunctional ADP-dependent NAD(P)H-hydrate dehydratase/NAD(P)H-hydrate epimerase [Corynebacterium lowii]|uniref:ADP-dependent (S)-NAD(P)H-hydrate dehydratase n=1 Tax=Corynebacterium lowii TaxID=1544413 RepID=A0A0Q1AJI2_9CORY|nr:bifunctional ADP-dependent NAD(P)H-hydrate dehydratase/NAD(P)H-hydrate epimerase [Corynebacterium lowii]KQB86996.1 Bifunctional NAD(P)H-hydrate repair enzyme Nnr [Corynebacterium lowii]MDP9852423.1 hydroxyethylthiazole kinase-like uncharacterized protein yjeF [Corynebacterium lowii]
MSRIYAVERIRRAEAVLLSAQTQPDQLIREAARAVASAAVAMLTTTVRTPEGSGLSNPDARVLLLVGTGGNGGDALYCGAFLREQGIQVDALAVGNTTHEGATRAFLQARGTFLEEAPERVGERAAWTYHLVIDGIAGLSGRAGLPDSQAWLADALTHSPIPVLAIDVPSGLPADTGRPPAPREVSYEGRTRTVAGFITATTTLTFGGLRGAHAAHTACGQVLCTDIALESGPSLGELLDQQEDTAPAFLHRSITPPAPEGFEPVPPIPVLIGELEPGGSDDKYSSGVVGVLAGSETYLGAGLLSTEASIRATPSMVRYMGKEYRTIVSHLPEVVGTATLEETGRVQAWVVGPGRGTDDHAAAELAAILRRPEPVLCDADALTLLAQRTELRELLCRRPRGTTVLTPHSGEFRRLSQAIGMESGNAPHCVPHWEKARKLSTKLGAVVVLKGRFSVVAQENTTVIIDAGHSWAATPGSGDVLSGLLGAWLARIPDQAHQASVIAVHLHAVASRIAAETPDGPAPTSASRIAEAISRASARELRGYRALSSPWR